jgi:hypothetical protein
MTIAGIAAGGLQQAQSSFESAAKNIASQSQTEDSVFLSTQVVSAIGAKDAFSANAASFKVADSIERTAIELAR